MWTLTAVAVRVAKAMGLHREGIPRSPFMTEIRRRLFHQIRFLDAYCCLDRGSEGLITPGSFDTLHPKNVNDSEFDANSTFIPNHEKKLTDQSFALLAYAATERTHLLFIPEDKSGATWQQRLEMAETFEREVHDKYIGLCDKSKPYQRMMFHVASGMVSSMKLRAVRPVQKHVSSKPPRVDSPYVLELAMNTLTASEAILGDPETSQWRWMIWVPWHGLAVTLAGLCAIRDTPLASKAWQAAESSYARNLRFVAEGRHGMLWRPIEKLYRKASTFRDHQENEPVSASTSPPPKGRGVQRDLQQQGQMGVAYPVNPAGTASPSNPVMDQSLLTMQDQQPLPNQTPLASATSAGAQLNHNALPHGGMPTAGAFPTPNAGAGMMDFDFNLADLNMSSSSGAHGIEPFDPSFGGGMDISMMDFERILEDMNMAGQTTGGADGSNGGSVQGVNLGDVQWPANVPPGGSWGCNLHGEMM